MAEDDEIFEYETIQDRETVVGYLKAITDGFREGVLLFGTADRKVILQPRGLVKVALEAKRKKNRNKLTFKISWRDDREDRMAGEPGLVFDTKRRKADE